MSLERVLPSPSTVGTVEERLHFLYARKTAIDDLIRSLEAYWQCTDAILRKPPGHVAITQVYQRSAL